MTVWSTLQRPDIPSTLTRQVWDSETARTLPGVGRALAVYGGLISGCALMHTRRGDVAGDRPRLLDRPDPDLARQTFIGVQVEDYLLHGNACHLVTVRDSYGYPAAARWYPAHRWMIWEDPRTLQPIYYLDGVEVRREDVVHVQRGADPSCMWRGVGVVEQHVRSLNRAGLEEAAETTNLIDRGMPAVAIITPQVEPKPAELTAAADDWVEKFAGVDRKPAFFPKDTQVVPLSWTPKDGQLIEARKMSLTDMANLFNLDGYYLGASSGSHTYRSPGPMFLVLLKISLNPVMDVFEDVWSKAWYPNGNEVRFDRSGLLQDDLLTMVQAFVQGSQFFPDPNEPRRYMGFPALPDEAWDGAAPAPEPAPEPEPVDDQGDDPDDPDDPETDPDADPETDPDEDTEGDTE